MTTPTKLDRQTRAFLERGFGEDFGSVTLSSRPSSWFPNGAMACAAGERVFVNRSTYRHGSELGRRVLAHELAHVVQKRSGRGLRTDSDLGAPIHWQVEAEAEAAADCVIRGGRFTCIIADDPEIPRFWGPLGHYYTVYFVMLAAGVTNDIARKLAYYTQIADLISELDAKWLAIHAYGANPIDKSIAEMMGITVAQYLLFKRHYRFQAEEFKEKLGNELQLRNLKIEKIDLRKTGVAMMTAKQYPTLKEIQVGLHCLSNGNVDKELEKRTNILGEAEWGTVEFGLAIHAYGDAFAHRRQDGSNTMYGDREGHAVDSKLHKDPDNIVATPERKDLWRKYATNLFTIVQGLKQNQNPHQAKDEKWLKQQLDLIINLIEAGFRDESKGNAFRHAAENHLKIKMHDYKPDNDALWWSRYEKSHDKQSADVPISEPDIRLAFLRAKEWTVRKE